MTGEQLHPRNWAAHILAPTARDIVPPVDEPPDAPPPGEPPPALGGQAEPEAPTPEPPAADEAFWSPGGAEAADVATPPVADASEMHRRIMSVATATERCTRVLSDLAERLDLLDEKVAARGSVASPAAPPEPVPGPSTELALINEHIGRLAAEVVQTHEQVSERFASIDALRSAVGALGSDIGAVQERLEEVARSQRVQQTGMSSSPVVQAMQRALGELRAELTTVGSHLVGVDARLDELQSLPARTEEMAASHFERLLSEVLSVPDDLEGVYRELEGIAERMAAREEAVARVIERAAAAEDVVTRLRLDLDRVIGDLAAARQAETEAREWREAIERRLAALEPSGSEVERLYRALDRMVGQRAADVGARGDPGGDEEGGNGPQRSAGPSTAAADDEAGDEGDDGDLGGKATSAPASGPSQQAVEALTAELERIRRSIEVVVGPRPRRPSGPRAHG